LFCGGLWSYLGEMKIPVIIYAITISLMGVMAFSRFGRVNSGSYKLIAIGAILFVTSDAFLAINRFMHSFQYSGVVIMATYMAAQYLITFGTIERRIKNKLAEA
ncbi:MAG TPA: lysoplasmalogenase, partial [Pedobacter sp.]|nr:lysoplasmalogenase [Pedobacter sp.]